MRQKEGNKLLLVESFLAYIKLEMKQKGGNETFIG
jgi:hypothetical protein